MDEIKQTIFVKFTKFTNSLEKHLNNKMQYKKCSRGILKKRPPARDVPIFHENDIYLR